MVRAALVFKGARRRAPVPPPAQTIADTVAWDHTRGQTWPMGAGITPEAERALLDAWRERE